MGCMSKSQKCPPSPPKVEPWQEGKVTSFSGLLWSLCCGAALISVPCGLKTLIVQILPFLPLVRGVTFLHVKGELEVVSWETLAAPSRPQRHLSGGEQRGNVLPPLFSLAQVTAAHGWKHL